MYSEFQHLNYDLLTIKRTRAPAGRAEKTRGVVVGWLGVLLEIKRTRAPAGRVETIGGGGWWWWGDDGFVSIY